MESGQRFPNSFVFESAKAALAGFAPVLAWGWMNINNLTLCWAPHQCIGERFVENSEAKAGAEALPSVPQLLYPS